MLRTLGVGRARGVIPSGFKADPENEQAIAAVNRCATQNIAPAPHSHLGCFFLACENVDFGKDSGSA
jgi:hypothetical protein